MNNQRLPFLDLQNKKMSFTENTKLLASSSKQQHQNRSKSPISEYNMSKDNHVCQSQQKMANIQIVKETIESNRSDIMNKSEEEMGEEEYKLCLKKALKESFEENDYLRKKIEDVMKENKTLKEDIEEKDGAILELAQFYEYCKLNHKEQEEEKHGNEVKDIEGNQKSKKNSF